MSRLLDDAPDETRQFLALVDALATDGHPARFWWRDDDAQTTGPKLQSLYALSRETGAPLVLAVIPNGCDDSVLDQKPDGLCIFQHGVVHQQLQAPGQKKCEFPADRPAREIFAALNTGRERLGTLYGNLFRPCLVPPWNRFPEVHKPVLVQAGFSHLSRYKSPDQSLLLPELGEINTHVDIIDWKSRTFVGTAAALRMAIDHLEHKLAGRCDKDEATGILSHHIDHDTACTGFLRDLFSLLMDHPTTTISSGQEICA